MKTYPCFGLEFLGQCHYDPTNPIVYFSIGQLIPLLVVILAVYKLLDPILKLRIESNRLFQFELGGSRLQNWANTLKFPNRLQPLSFVIKYFFNIKMRPFYWLIFISICSVFVASIISSIPNFYQIPVLGYPIFWEILSGLILVILGFSCIKIISEPARLNKHNYKIFFDHILHIIDRKDEKELAPLARELIPSLEILLSICTEWETLYIHIQDLAKKKYYPNKSSFSLRDLDKKIEYDEELKRKSQSSEIQNRCFRIINILSDREFCKVIACKVPEFSENLISLFNPNNLYVREQDVILKNILEASFENEDSILNRENQNDGLSKINNLTQLVFTNRHIFYYMNFSSIVPSIYTIKFIKEWQIKLYFSCLREALKFSFKVQDPQTLMHIHSGCLHVESLLEKILLNDTSFNHKQALFGHVHFEMMQVLYLAHENKEKIRSYHSRAHNLLPMFYKDKERTNEVSLYHILAKSIFDFFIILSRVNVNSPQEQSSIRFIGFDLLDTITMENDAEIGEILIRYIKFHINEHNFTNRLSPYLTQYIISCVGLRDSKKENNILRYDMLLSFRFYLLQKLKKEFHSLYMTDKEFALDLLPYNVSYDPKTKIMTQIPLISRFRKEIKLQCE